MRWNSNSINIDYWILIGRKYRTERIQEVTKLQKNESSQFSLKFNYCHTSEWNFSLHTGGLVTLKSKTSLSQFTKTKWFSLINFKIDFHLKIATNQHVCVFPRFTTALKWDLTLKISYRRRIMFSLSFRINFLMLTRLCKVLMAEYVMDE